MCRRQSLTPLSPAERSVAERHYRLVEWYVRHRGLPVEEYYDVAVFGYLLAVKRWFSRPDLYRYEFTTIACAAMRSAIGRTATDRPLAHATLRVRRLIEDGQEVS